MALPLRRGVHHLPQAHRHVLFVEAVRLQPGEVAVQAAHDVRQAGIITVVDQVGRDPADEKPVRIALVLSHAAEHVVVDAQVEGAGATQGRLLGAAGFLPVGEHRQAGQRHPEQRRREKAAPIPCRPAIHLLAPGRVLPGLDRMRLAHQHDGHRGEACHLLRVAAQQDAVHAPAAVRAEDDQVAARGLGLLDDPG